MPLAEAYCSRQPRRPQPHSSGSAGFTVMWPISPAAPLAPAATLPSTTTPPPTPVPSVMSTQLLRPHAPPCQSSPSAAALASFT